MRSRGLDHLDCSLAQGAPCFSRLLSVVQELRKFALLHVEVPALEALHPLPYQRQLRQQLVLEQAQLVPSRQKEWLKNPHRMCPQQEQGQFEFWLSSVVPKGIVGRRISHVLSQFVCLRIWQDEAHPRRVNIVQQVRGLDQRPLNMRSKSFG